MDLLNSHPDERIRLVAGTLAQVVTDERGGDLVVHTFIHEPAENGYVHDALKGDPRTDYVGLSKIAPNDWQPYYPVNPILGDLGDRVERIEIDLGGEYWGRGVLPFCEVENLRWRIEQAIRRGATGVSARVERGCDAALGTPNEVNLYALSRFADEPEADPRVVWDEWIERRYGLATGTEAARTLIDALASTFDVGRKMYYVEGFWVFLKGSDFPEVARSPEMLAGRSNAKWDPDWQGRFDDLSRPSADTVARIWQEKTEAVDRAAANLAAVQAIQASLAPADYDDLAARLTNQWYATRLWRLAADVIFRYQLVKRTGDAAQARLLEGSARSLSALADEVEDALGSGAWPGNPARVREFLADLRSVFPAQDETENFAPETLSAIRAENVTADSAEIAWTSSAPATGQAEYGIDLPDYGSWSARAGDLTTEHRVTLPGLSPNTHYFVRVHSTLGDESEFVSGDYRFRTGR
jgi:hypothetical protein